MTQTIPSPRVGIAYRVLADTALTAGIIAIAATIQHRRYQPHP